ncbi:MAG: chorismate mutase [Oligoflexales bacterium]
MITSIDAQIILLIERRMKVAERIGREKTTLGLPIQDLETERKVRSHMKQLDHSLKIEGCGDDLADFLMNCAKKIQIDRRQRLDNFPKPDEKFMPTKPKSCDFS